MVLRDLRLGAKTLRDNYLEGVPSWSAGGNGWSPLARVAWADGGSPLTVGGSLSVGYCRPWRGSGRLILPSFLAVLSSISVELPAAGRLGVMGLKDLRWGLVALKFSLNSESVRYESEPPGMWCMV